MSLLLSMLGEMFGSEGYNPAIVMDFANCVFTDKWKTLAPERAGEILDAIVHEELRTARTDIEARMAQGESPIVYTPAWTTQVGTGAGYMQDNEMALMTQLLTGEAPLGPAGAILCTDEFMLSGCQFAYENVLARANPGYQVLNGHNALDGIGFEKGA
ncbi:hypothetical protein AUJ68_04650 [Candidatus Woesearchaeota archaeon CG1_02_57_44]|nr:MAG: hypothetical protein AUJ68_04650 [Candidatus Woesearchaeota archaeon CG1_02_57_44]